LPTRKGALTTGRGALPTRKGALTIGRDALPTRKGALTTGRGALPTRKGALTIGRDALPTRHESMPTGNDARPTRRDALPTGNDARPTRRGALPTRNDARPRRNGALTTGSDARPTSRDPPPVVKDDLSREYDAFTRDAASFARRPRTPPPRQRRSPMTTATKSIRRATVTLMLPKAMPALIVYPQGLVTRMTGNASFPSPTPHSPRSRRPSTTCAAPRRRRCHARYGSVKGIASRRARTTVIPPTRRVYVHRAAGRARGSPLQGEGIADANHAVFSELALRTTGERCVAR
jgi:hypothetical protein